MILVPLLTLWGAVIGVEIGAEVRKNSNSDLIDLNVITNPWLVVERKVYINFQVKFEMQVYFFLSDAHSLLFRSV